VRKRCTKGKSCGATCITQSDRCVLELGPIISKSITQIRSKLGVVKLYDQVREQKVKGFQGKFNRIRKELKQEVGGQIRASRDVLELKKRLQKEGLLPKSAKSDNIADIFMRGIEAGKKEKEAQRAPSVPSDLKRQIAALGAPRQLERSPGARTRTPMNVQQDLKGIITSAKKGETELIFDDISRMLRGETPKNIQVASAAGPEGFKARLKPSGVTTGNTQWAREDAKDFDSALKIIRKEGDSSYKGWEDSYRSGARKIGEGSYGTVIRNSDGTFIKRGDISDTEASLIKRLGEKDLGPKLIAASINGKAQYHDEDFVNIKKGRIAMNEVEGKPIGNADGTKKLGGGITASDAYWKAMADLHRMGIAHNDAHIDNILVDKNGKGRWVDLGLAQASPKAALAEALGVFGSTLQNVDPYRNMPSNAAGHLYKRDGQLGNWQTARWDGTGVPAFQKLIRAGKSKEAEEKYPLLYRVYENRRDVQYKLIKQFDRAEVASIMEHGIRSPLDSYTKGPWAKMTDEQAQSYLNMLYDGI
jgi:hypothetical protein